MDGKKARHYFENGYMCTESVLLAVCESERIVSPVVPAIATGFCSGTARTNGICGALQGGILAISLKHGRTSAKQSPDECYKMIRALKEDFEKAYTTNNCFSFTGCDLSTDEGRKKFKTEKIKEKVCLDLAENVTELTLKKLREYS